MSNGAYKLPTGELVQVRIAGQTAIITYPDGHVTVVRAN